MNSCWNCGFKGGLSAAGACISCGAYPPKAYSYPSAPIHLCSCGYATARRLDGSLPTSCAGCGNPISNSVAKAPAAPAAKAISSTLSIPGCFAVDKNGIVEFAKDFDKNSGYDWERAKKADPCLAGLVCELVATRDLYKCVSSDLEHYAQVLQKKDQILVEIAKLPGPHFSAAAKTAVALAQKALA